MSRFGEVSALVMNSNDRLKGVGHIMIDYAEKLAKELGCKGTWFVSGFWREEEAHQFYERLGYHMNGYRFIYIIFEGKIKSKLPRSSAVG